MEIDQIKETFDIDVGAPMPTIVANVQLLYLIFYTRTKADQNEKIDDLTTDNLGRIVTLKFNKFAEFKFSNPNDESLSGHPYFKLGLKPYSIQKVVDSDWINELKNMNSVHPYHQDRHFVKYKHLIFTFRDICFEIVSESYTIEKSSRTDIKEEIRR